MLSNRSAGAPYPRITFDRALRVLLCIVVFLGTVSPLAAAWNSLPGRNIFINLPAGWKIHQANAEKVVASNKAEEAFFLLRLYPGNKADNVKELDAFVRKDLGAEGGGISPGAGGASFGGGEPAEEGKRFSYAGREAKYGTITFSTTISGGAKSGTEQNGGRKNEVGQSRERPENTETTDNSGFLLSIDGYKTDIAALSFTSSKGMDAYRDMLLSTLDSLSLGESGIVSPGPVSVYHSPYPAETGRMYRIHFGDKKIPVIFGDKELSVSQDFIEREARLLSLYQGSEYAIEAWKRYYRLMYRYQYARVAPIFAALNQHVFTEDKTNREIAERLLAWIQEFEYKRLNTMSDCLSPMRSAVEHVGDCDSRSLLLVMLLHHFDIDAVLMVSAKHSHSLAGVDVKGKGARFPLGEKKYLVAETTEDVDIGLIEKSMWNIQTWVGIDFIRFRGNSLQRER